MSLICFLDIREGEGGASPSCRTGVSVDQTAVVPVSVCTIHIALVSIIASRSTSLLNYEYVVRRQSIRIVLSNTKK